MKYSRDWFLGGGLIGERRRNRSNMTLAQDLEEKAERLQQNGRRTIETGNKVSHAGVAVFLTVMTLIFLALIFVPIIMVLL